MIKSSRALGIDYLHPLVPFTCGLYIPNLDNQEHINFNTYFVPFKLEVWLLIIISSIIVSIVKIILLYKFGAQQITGLIGVFWTSFMANFGGGKPKVTPLDSRHSYRILIFTSLLIGTITFINWRCMLGASLAVTIKKYPFTDMDSLSNTEWR